MTIQKLWARDQKFYNPATELCISDTENPNLEFFISKTSISDKKKKVPLNFIHISKIATLKNVFFFFAFIKNIFSPRGYEPLKLVIYIYI